LLRSAANAGATILMAMHDLTLATAVADEIWLLDRGRLLACGPAAQVMEPLMLQRVFGIGFSWVGAGDGGRQLLADLPLP
jgi:iron complex transport system ATP-binding protein